jgi:hypothetical protein
MARHEVREPIDEPTGARIDAMAERGEKARILMSGE